MLNIMLWTFLLAPLLTIGVEFPIIYFPGICRKPVYIAAVNGLTNLTLNLLSLLFTCLFGYRIRILWLLLAELLLIPNAEALLYRIFTPQKIGKVYLFTYLSNAASYLAGVLLTSLMTGGFSLLP